MFRNALRAAALLCLFFALGQFTARAQEAGAYAITYVEASHGASDRVTALLKGLSASARKASGNLRFDAVQRQDRRNQFAIVEAWKDKAAFESHVASAYMKDFRDKLAPVLITAYDERPHVALAVGPVQSGANAGSSAVYVVTHVDVIPPKKDEAIQALTQLVNASRGEPGSLRFEALQQVSRPNHSTLVEIWNGMASLEAHEMAAHTKSFREQLTPMSGSLYDQRIYKLLN